MASSGVPSQNKNYLAHQTCEAICVSAPNPHELFDKEFQMELGRWINQKDPPVAPARLVFDLILQAYTPRLGSD